MKANILTLIFLYLTLSAYSQDVIVKNDQTEIKAKIEEITETTIKYKKFEMLDGPTYNINVKDVFMIIYKNGTKEYMKAAIPQTAPVAAGTPGTTPVSQNTAGIKPAGSNGYPGGHSMIIKEGRFYMYEGKKIRSDFDVINIYNQLGYQDLSRRLKSKKGLYYGLGFGGCGVMMVGVIMNITAIGGERRAPIADVLMLGGAGSALTGGFILGSARKSTRQEFNLRAGNKVSQTVKISPAIGFDPAGKGGKIGVSIDF